MTGWSSERSGQGGLSLNGFAGPRTGDVEVKVMGVFLMTTTDPGLSRFAILASLPVTINAILLPTMCVSTFN